MFGKFVTHGIVALILISSVEGICNFGQLTVFSWNETAPPGSQFFNLTKDLNTNVTFAVGTIRTLKTQYVDQLKQCFILTTGDTWFALTSNRTLDLEYFYREWATRTTIRYIKSLKLDQIRTQTAELAAFEYNGDDVEHAVLDSIYLDFYCGRGNSIQVTIQNTPVNENTPVFLQSPYSTNVSELTRDGTEIYSLTNKVSDEDIPPTSNFLFGIQPYIIRELDGREYFDLQGGDKVILKKTVDYDTLPIKYFILNISVADSAVLNQAMTAYTTLNIIIEDADDQNPEFVHAGCARPCLVPEYKATIGLTDTVITKGEVVVVPAIQAIDSDTLNTPLSYSIESGNEHNLFHMNSQTAGITQQRSVLEEGIADDRFRLVIKVAKENHPELRALAVVTVSVRERMPSYNGTVPTLPTDAASPEKKSDDLLIPVIILGVLLFILIIAIIIVVIIVRRKQKQTVSPGDTKSEPHTEEEELPTDRDEHYHEQAKSQEKLIPTLTSSSLVYAEAPHKRAGLLPPLPSRDFATETEDITKKKRSRRRKKKKEPEIFDGTKEYNMGADPEFFDSTDKSKVKRSTRSYPKETDPQLRLKVPNDEPEPESVYM